MMKRICFLGLLIVSGVFTQVATALPYSTFGKENGWAGYYDYTENDYDLRVYFNVYDISLDEFDWQGENPIPPEDNYIYAYQIFNNEPSKKLGYFALLDDFGGDFISENVMHGSTSQADGYGGDIRPDSGTTNREGVWGWSNVHGYVMPGDRSWYLIFSSDMGPVKGGFEILEEPLEATKPPRPVPEPGTIALISITSALFAANQKRKHRTK